MLTLKKKKKESLGITAFTYCKLLLFLKYIASSQNLEADSELNLKYPLPFQPASYRSVYVVSVLTA
jgi:hypothetical protein